MIKRRYSRYCAIMSRRSQCERSKVYRNSIDYVLLHTFDESQSLGKLHHQRYADSILPIKDKESYRRVTACYSLSITCLKEREKERREEKRMCETRQSFCLKEGNQVSKNRFPLKEKENKLLKRTYIICAKFYFQCNSSSSIMIFNFTILLPRFSKIASKNKRTSFAKLTAVFSMDLIKILPAKQEKERNK